MPSVASGTRRKQFVKLITLARGRVRLRAWQDSAKSSHRLLWQPVARSWCLSRLASALCWRRRFGGYFAKWGAQVVRHHYGSEPCAEVSLAFALGTGAGIWDFDDGYYDASLTIAAATPAIDLACAFGGFVDLGFPLFRLLHLVSNPVMEETWR